MPVQTSVLVTPANAFGGMLADDAENDIITMKNADAVSMPFGYCVAFKTSSPSSDLDAILPATSGAKLAGIIVHKQNYSRTFTLPDGTVAGELDSVGIVVGTGISVLRRGRIWVQVQQSVVPGDRLFVCYTAATIYTAIGQLGNADESSNTIDATRVGVFLTTAAAGKFAKLEVDFPVKLG